MYVKKQTATRLSASIAAGRGTAFISRGAA
jgi:hypothetical protein